MVVNQFFFKCFAIVHTLWQFYKASSLPYSELHPNLILVPLFGTQINAVLRGSWFKDASIFRSPENEKKASYNRVNTVVIIIVVKKLISFYTIVANLQLTISVAYELNHFWNANNIIHHYYSFLFKPKCCIF